MLNYTKTTLNKLIHLFNEQDYSVRFEKGHFQSGYAVVHERKIVVINKFFDTEARINTLLEILDGIQVDPMLMDERSKNLYKSLLRDKLINKQGE